MKNWIAWPSNQHRVLKLRTNKVTQKIFDALEPHGAFPCMQQIVLQQPALQFVRVQLCLRLFCHRLEFLLC